MRESQVVDLEKALDRLGGDKPLYRELLGMLFEVAPGQVQEMIEAVEKGDAVSVEQVAHSLKGAAASLEAGPVRDLAARLEILGRETRLADAAMLLAHLETELERLRRFTEEME